MQDLQIRLYKLSNQLKIKIMTQEAQTVPPKGLYTLQVSDFVKGLGFVLFGNLAAALIFLIRQDHWPSWVEWQPYAESALTVFLAYIGKNFFTNNVGEVFTQDKPVVKVDIETLDNLKQKAQNNN